MGSKKSKTTQTTTPINPAWVEPQIQGLAGNITGLANRDPAEFVAPANGLLQQAYSNAQDLQPQQGAYEQANGLFGAMMNVPAQQIQAASLLSNLDAYMNPYTRDVVDTSLADYDFGAGQTRAQNLLALAGDSTFGGSGGAIQTAMSNDAIDRGRASLSSGLRSQAFNTGAQLSSQDAERRQSAAATNAQLYEQALARQQQAGRDLLAMAHQYDDDRISGLNAQASIGQIMQGIQQSQAAAPLTTLSSLVGDYGQLPVSLLHGETSTSKTKTSGGLGDILGGLGALATGLGSGGLGLSFGSLLGGGTALSRIPIQMSDINIPGYPYQP